MGFYEVFLIVTLFTYSHQQKCLSVKRMDTRLTNLTSHNNQEEEKCCGICYETLGCKGYAWNSYDGGTCWLMGRAFNQISTSEVNFMVLASTKIANNSSVDVSWGKLVNEYKHEISNVGQFNADFVVRKKRGVLTCPSLKFLKNENYEVHCTFSTKDFELQSVDCDTETFIGVKATYRCKPYFKHTGSHSTASRICLPNGRWSALSNYFACDLECGLKNDRESEAIASEVPSAEEQWPWLAAIFRKHDEDFLYVCGATLIAKNVILTGSFCAFEEDDKFAFEEDDSKQLKAEVDPKQMKVVLNPVSSDLSENYKNARSQILEVKEIIAHSNHNSSDFGLDIALIVLENQVEINDAVHPVCFPNGRDGSNEIANQMSLPGSEGYVVGFGLDGRYIGTVVRENKLSLANHQECTELVKGWQSADSSSKLFCAYNPSQTLFPSDRGGGYFVGSYISDRLRYHVQGIVFFDDLLGEFGNKKRCTVFAHLVSLQSWIVNTLQDIIDSTKRIKCPSLKPTENSNLEVRCTFPSENPELYVSNCENESFVGAIAIYSCKPYFTNIGSNVITSEITCLPNGTWSAQNEVFACGLDCGIKNTPKNKFITHGVSSSTEQWPWFAAIFRKEGGNSAFICGGSLIAENVILTASHCVTDEEGNALWSKMFTIVVGAVSSNLLGNYENTRAQIIKVKEIISHSLYNPDNLEGDIALLVLEKDAIINDAVHPVCIPNGEGNSNEITQQMLITGSQGYIVGFGLDETWKISPTLKEIKLPVVTHGDCKEVLGQRHTSTQFCAGYTNGSSPCHGDSGGGFYFPSKIHGGRYYVQGLVSYGGQTAERRCDNKKYTVFTRILSFQSWIIDKLQVVFALRDVELLTFE